MRGRTIAGLRASSADVQAQVRAREWCRLKTGSGSPWDTAAVKFYASLWLASGAAVPDNFHESFWLAAGAAAPVIALAAALFLPEWTIRGREATRAEVDADLQAQRSGSKDYDQRYRQLSKMAWYVRSSAVINVCLQAAVLALSLASLQSQVNEWQPWAIISFTVGGLLWLGWSSLQAGKFRAEWRDLHGGKGSGGGA